MPYKIELGQVRHEKGGNDESVAIVPFSLRVRVIPVDAHDDTMRILGTVIAISNFGVTLNGETDSFVGEVRVPYFGDETQFDVASAMPRIRGYLRQLVFSLVYRQNALFNTEPWPDEEIVELNLKPEANL